MRIGVLALTRSLAFCAFAAAAAWAGMAASSQQAAAAPEGLADTAAGVTGLSPAANHPGAPIYRETCASCHDAGVNRAPQPINLKEMRPEAILAALTSGAMREQGKALTAAQKTAVAEFLSGRPMGAASTAAAPRMCEGERARFDLAEPPVFSGWGLDPAGTHAIPANISGLDRTNVGRLRLKWAFAFPDASRVRSHPTLAGGAIFVGNHNGSVYALDRETGCVRWSFAAQAEIRTGIVVAPWQAGDRRARPLVYFGDVMGNVYAVNAFTGRLAWKIDADPHPAAIVTGTPTLWQGTLYVPVSSNEEAFATNPGYSCCDFRGSILALDARTGRRKWQTFLVDAPQVRGTNRQGLDVKGPSGVAVWNSPTVDAKRGQLIFATGDNYSLPATGLSDSIVALDLATGKIRWHYQALANDAWNVSCITRTSDNCPDEDAPDFDFGAGTVLAKASNGREVVMAGQKSGWVYGLDPADGKLIWQRQVGRGSPIGGVHFGMAANGGRLFVPVSDRFVMPNGTFPASPGLNALDIATGELLWHAASPEVCNGKPLCTVGYGGGVTATAGLALIGGDDGHLRIYDGANGQVLWDVDTARDFTTVNGSTAHGGAISGGLAPIAYKGSVIVPSGYGFASKMTGNVLLVYAVE